ncbi:MAG TPA: pyroglutamyl-peptidase I [Candidatus Acidoferrales bacterium]|jgi:pyroglutamyl-peptidase|nr:pyroglutamyl-peptidase I [Candidatus Acidoferrales bacterium]
MPPILVLTGFEPFRGERINPSWEVARSFDGEVIGGLQIKSVRVPVGCAKAARRIRAAIVRYRPRAVIGLGEAGGRPAISLERIAINLADERGALATIGDPGFTPVVRDGPDAYFSRLPLRAIVRELDRNTIPASVSLTAGAYACNALMYAALHYLRRKPAVPVGFIHLPYADRQAGRHRSLPSMMLTQMETAVRIAIVETARAAKREG